MNKDDIKVFNKIAEDILQYVNKQFVEHIYKRKNADEKRNLELVLNVLQAILTTNLWGNGLFRKIYLFDDTLKHTLLNDIIDKVDKTMEQLHLQRMEELKCGETLH